jgi:hypothetical protein
VTEWDEVKRTMTWSRYREIHERWRYEPPIDALLAYIASAYGYKPPQPPKTGPEAALELMKAFPTGMIKG